MDLYVGSIPFKWKEKDLHDLFAQFGEVVSVKIIIDKITRQNKGFGFVTMADSAAAQRAITALHATELEGRSLVVNPSVPKGEFQKPQRTAPAGSRKKPIEFKSDKHKKSLPPWLRKEY
ncbi:MAG: RNA-binding protein [Saprospiraceae bacterium]|nr:RNA-binding protein [Saprospiraceae bacterium]MBK8669980.1 RNA-binding protein [Saprospiraceae bacterium]MBL0100367.1 RNA-binding protein [Saprospiraceae bacterium]